MNIQKNITFIYKYIQMIYSKKIKKQSRMNKKNSVKRKGNKK